MSTLIKALLLWLLSSFYLASHAESPATAVDPSCRSDLNDPNDVGYRLSDFSSKYSGLCINSETLRPLKNFKLDGDKISFNNYMHDNRFWRAQFTAQKIKAVYFQIMRFAAIEGVTAAHTQIRFVFEDPKAVQLSKDSDSSFSGDILVSFEAAFPKDVSYNFALGAFSNYAIFARILSTEQKQKHSAEEIEQYELNLTDEEKSSLLKESLRYAEKLGISSFYNTLRPNCTTEVFDLLDKLPRLKDQQPPFLTVISTDPIASPSIKALQNRGLLVKRVQDFSKEQKGIFENPPLPLVQETLSPFLADVKGFPWSLNIIKPDTSALSSSEKQALEEAYDELLTSLPYLLQNYGALSLLSLDDNKGLFLSALESFISTPLSTLKRLNSRLPKEGLRLGFYFSPYEAKTESTDLRALGLPAELPFAVKSFELGQTTSQGIIKPADIYHSLNVGIGKAAENSGSASTPAQLTALALVLHLERDNSRIFTQVAAALKPQEQALSSESPQVRIEGVVVPTAPTNIDRPLVILTHAQNVENNVVSEALDIQFGAFGGLAGSAGQYGLGTLQVFKDTSSCRLQTASTPYFRGKINDKFTGFGLIDGLLKDSTIQFHLTRMSLNLKTQKIDEMKLAIQTLGLSCLGSNDAERQFTENANKALSDLLNQSESPLGLISPLLN